MSGGWTRDLTLTWRRWRQSPVFAISLMLTLALPLGAITTLAIIADQLFVSGAPLPRPEELVRVYTDFERLSDGERFFTVSYPNYEDIASLEDVFTGAVCERPISLNWFVFERAEKRWAYVVSPNYFELLEVRPRIGRFFSPEESEAGIVLSHRRWQSDFGSSPDIVGKTVSLNGRPFRIIGVTPPGFSGMTYGLQPDLFVPVDLETRLDAAGSTQNQRSGAAYFVIARKRPEAALPAIEARLDTLAARLRTEHPVANRVVEFRALSERDGRIHPMAHSGFLGFTRILAWVFAASLALACANAACLLLARGVARRNEIRVRQALGATRSRLIRQLLTESLANAAVAALAGAVLSSLLFSLIRSVAWPADWPIVLHFEARPAIFLFVFLVTVSTTLVFGLVPALETSKRGLQSGADQRRVTTGRPSWYLGLVAAQIAIGFSLLFGTGLFIQSLAKVDELDLGFDPSALVMANIDLSLRDLTEADAERWLFEMADELERSETVESAGITTTLPFDLNIVRATVHSQDRLASFGTESFSSDVSSIDEGYFPTMKIAFLGGRNFNSRDRRPSRPRTRLDGREDVQTRPSGAHTSAPPTRVAIVNEAFARRISPDAISTLGKRIEVGRERLRIVGVVRDGKYLSLGDYDKPWLYLPMTPSASREVAIIARADSLHAADSAAIGVELRHIAAAKNPLIGVYRLRTMSQQLALPLLPPRVGAIVGSAFGIVALILSVIALYGTLTFQVGARQKEIGIRRALGATRTQIVSMLSHNTLIAVVSGLGLGLIGCRFIRSLVLAFLIADENSFTFLPATLSGTILALTAGATIVVAAGRALNISLAEALRQEDFQ